MVLGYVLTIRVSKVRVSEFFVVVERIASRGRMMVIMIDIMTIVCIPILQFFLIFLILLTVKRKKLLAS